MGNVIVLFEVVSTKEGMNRYLELAKHLNQLVSGFDGFISAERFQSLSEDGKLLSMNVWENEEAVVRWRNIVEHRMGQQEGRDKLFQSYKITIASAMREYTANNRNQAPKDSNQYFGVS